MSKLPDQPEEAKNEAMSDWTHIEWDSSALLEVLVKVRHCHGQLVAAPLGVFGSAIQQPSRQPRTQIHRQILTTEQLQQWSSSSTAPMNSASLQQVERLLSWWNDSPVGLDGILRAGIAYIWFIRLSPFLIGNEHVGQKIIELAMMEDDNNRKPTLTLDLSFMYKSDEVKQQVQLVKNQHGDITAWLKWFLEQLLQSLQKQLEQILSLSRLKLNERQKKIILHLLSTPGDFVAVTNRECVTMCGGASRESIKRDLGQLVHWGVLAKTSARGRSICYQLAI